MDNIKLLGLQRAEFQRAEKLNSFASKSQILAVTLSIVGLLIQNCPIAIYILSILSVIAALGWLYFSEQSKYSHSTAEKARRTILLVEGLGIKLQPKFYSDLQILFKEKEEDAKKWEDQNYFKSNKDYGTKKLAEMLEESAFWTKFLLREYAKRTWFIFAALISICLLILLLIQIFKVGQSSIIVGQVVCLILVWLATGSIFSKALTLSNSAHEISLIEDKLNNIVFNNQASDSVIVLMSDYNSIIEGTPVIPSKIYENNKDKLNLLWNERNTNS